MKKATRKILSLALVVMMLLGTFAMMFAYAAEEPVTTPKAYADAADGETLLNVNFGEHFTHVDDRFMSFDNNGTTYMPDGEAQSLDPADNRDKNGDGKIGGYGADSWAFVNGWHKSLTEDAETKEMTATVVEENGAALKIDGKVPAVGTEGEAGYVPEVPSDVTGTDSRYIGYIDAYSLENSTYTYEFEYFRKGVVRSKFYFGNGSWINFGSCDQYMPCLGIELAASAYRTMRQSSATGNAIGKPNYTVNAAGETTAQMKVVLEGGAVIENCTLWASLQTKAPAEGVATGKWVGNVIPVTYSIYNSITKEDGTVQDIRCSTGIFYQPADIGLVFGVGEYNNLSNNQYYGARNLTIKKGDTSIPFTFGFTQVYADAGWGSELTQFDAKGITNAANNYANGYEWVNQGSVTVDAEGVVTINRTDKGATQGAYTPHPFGDEWNQGYYEMELTVNNASRLKIGLLMTADADRVGFNILPNVANADLTTGSKTAYLHADAGNAATLWTSAANSFGTGIVEKSTAALADDITTIVYDTYKADEANVPNPDFDATKPAGEDNPEFIKDGIPEDPRNVRDYGGNRANIKIVYNCVDYIITLYEKVDGEWLPTSAIDYSAGIENETILGACLDFQAYNANTNATIKNIRTMKGSSVVHQTNWAIGDYVTDTYFGYDADFQANITEDFVDYYGLWNYEFGWTNDGATVVEDFETLYNALDESNYGPQTIKLAPIVKYEAATEAVLRGLRVDADDEKGTYDVDFVVALDAIEDIAVVGYDIVKTVDFGGYTKTTTVNVETTEVFASINANGLKLDAAAALGAGQYTEGEGEEAVTYGYVAAFGLEDEAVVEGAVVTYEVVVYTVALDGTKTATNETVTYTFVEGEYMPSLWY